MPLPPSPAPRASLLHRLPFLVAALVLLLGACTDSAADGPTTSAPPPTEATVPATVPEADTTVGTAPDETAPAASLAPDVDPVVAAAVADDVAELIEVTERIRGLEFLEPPTVTVLSAAGLAARVRADLAEEDPLVVEDSLYTMLGILDPEIDLDALLAELLAEQVLGYYDGDTGELVVAADAELTPFDQLTLVHELIHALTDQHFGFHDRAEQLDDDARFDELSALLALVEGDATYFELVFFQEELEFPDQVEIAQQITEIDTVVFDSSPLFLQADLGFPYDQGYRFVSRLVGEGGIAAVDAAYAEPPDSTEEVLHPEQFFNALPADGIDLPPTPIAGYEIYEEASLGEWGAVLLFIETDGRAVAEQIGDGWGADAYRVLTGPAGEVLFLWRFVADREQDAVEVAQGLIGLAARGMALGEGVESGDGLLFETDAGYAFVDRVGDEVFFVAASDPQAGADARAALLPDG